MKREIKFRLIKDNKIVGYERFDHGSWHYSRDGIQWNYTRIAHDDKDQYIRQNVNNQEVYEGDILTDAKRMIPPEVMMWNEEWAGFRPTGYHYNTNTRLEDTWLDTVIGNIHEHPELLDSN
jgi:hypothetical protein